MAKTCEAMGVGDTALRRWVSDWHAEKAAPPRTAEQTGADARRIKELEKRVVELERERDILKESTAFFVKETDRLSK